MENRMLCSTKQFANIFASVCFIILINNKICSQSNNHSFGAILQTPAQYASLPKVDWNVLAIYSQSKAFALKSTSANGNITMLKTPPIGDQGQTQGSCVAWAVGYCALSILTYSKYGFWDNVVERSPSYYNTPQNSDHWLS